MDDQVEEKPNNRVNAGRGIVVDENTNSIKNTTLNQGDDKDSSNDDDRPDERARKAGY